MIPDLLLDGKETLQMPWRGISIVAEGHNNNFRNMFHNRINQCGKNLEYGSVWK